MRKIEHIIVNVLKAEELMVEILKTEFEVPEPDAKNYANRYQSFFSVLKDNCWLIAESPYIDRVYRDSYYHYYSSKLLNYKRDCVKISIFEEEITLDDFRDPAKAPALQTRYRGFYVLRPTVPFFIGRSVISPKALKSNNFRICSTKIHSTVNSLKFEIEGFPHSSQDTETITCAETTLWAIMEYFGTKYPDYKPVLPSKIIDVLNQITIERQIPSKGLNIQQMSYALKAFGFGTRLYSEDVYGTDDFKKLYSCYVESGIPLVVALDNTHIAGGNIGHAILCIGYQPPDNAAIDNLTANTMTDINGNLLKELAAKNVSIFDWDDIDKKFIFVDDNHPAYQQAEFNTPANHYPKHWHTCSIKNFVVPLYSKIYLEAFEAKKFVMNYLTFEQPLINNSNVLVRFFLTSSRSFKDSLALNSSFDVTIKKLVLNTSMPKFVWIAELSDKALMKAKQANGLLILDATEANIKSNMLIISVYQDVLSLFKANNRVPDKYYVNLSPFNIYNKNLKTF